MTIRQIDRRTAAMLGERIERALADLAREMGVRLAYRGCRYGTASAEFRVEATVPGALESRSDRARRAFAMLAQLHGLDATDYGREFVHPVHGPCVVAGLIDRASRMPVLFRRLHDDAMHRCDAVSMRAFLRKPTAQGPSARHGGLRRPVPGLAS